jgi:hypothetical protein
MYLNICIGDYGGFYEKSLENRSVFLCFEPCLWLGVLSFFQGRVKFNCLGFELLGIITTFAALKMRVI